MSDAPIEVEFDKTQLASLKATLQMISPNTAKAIRKRIKPAGQIVVAEIQRRAPFKTGLTRNRTSARVRETEVRISNTAKSKPTAKYPRGYRYPKRLEFDAATYKGRYRFFYPGFEAKKAEAVRELDKILEDVGRGFSIGGA